jgi:uncharacterized protein YheU (UPF0270 family)
VPNELAIFNRMATRLIGLGISFTTCVNLYKDGQEFTRGNAINYWNDLAETVRELPRPLRTSGVVLLSSKKDNTTSYFKVRPDLIRRALVWLIANNPLYEGIVISEVNLLALEDLNVSQEIPRINVTDEEVEQLRGNTRQVNSERESDVLPENDNVMSSLENSISSLITEADTFASVRDDRSPLIPNISEEQTCARALTTSQEEEAPEDILDNLTESFELEGNDNGKQSELERIMNDVGVNNTVEKCPRENLRVQPHTNPCD